MPAWLDQMTSRRGAGIERVYMRTFGGTFAIGARRWCFAPVVIQSELIKKLTYGQEYFYPPGSDDSAMRRVLSAVEGHASWHRASRSELYLFATSVGVMAEDNASSLSASEPGYVPGPLELPSGLIVSGVPMDAEELADHLAFLPSEDLDTARMVLPIGPGGAPVTALVLRWGSPAAYLAIHECGPLIRGYRVAPSDEWIDWHDELARNAADVAAVAPKKN